MTGIRYFIVDDDAGTRRMLQMIIEESDLGEVVGTASSGIEAVTSIITRNPDVVLIDMLMPDQDGIETMEQLQKRGFTGIFMMISQVVNKEMVGEAYRQGVEFFVHKPINRIEVESVLSRIKEHLQLKRSLQMIKQSLMGIGESLGPSRQQAPAVKDVVMTILGDIGIAGDSGSTDLVRMIEVLVEEYRLDEFPPLKELYEKAAKKGSDVQKEAKAMEQRIRRMILSALDHLASIGLTDYSNPKFEHYATRYFDFADVRARMRDLEGENDNGKVKVNIKKFLQVLYLETKDRVRK